MLSIRRTARFKKDVRRVSKRNKDLTKLKDTLELLVRQKTLPARYQDHELVGDHAGVRDCHIESDWLLLYRLTAKELILIRIGTHSDLFE